MMGVVEVHSPIGAAETVTPSIEATVGTLAIAEF